MSFKEIIRLLAKDFINDIDGKDFKVEKYFLG